MRTTANLIKVSGVGNYSTTLQKRMWAFRFIRLLNALMFVIHTWQDRWESISGSFCVMAMSVKESEIIISILTALRARDDMVYFHDVSFLEIQSTFWAFTFLSFEEFWCPLMDFRVFTHSDTPIYPVFVVRLRLFCTLTCLSIAIPVVEINV
jgi:hypothetical protein